MDECNKRTVPLLHLPLLHLERGVKLGRKVGSVKTTEQKREEHKDIISYLKRGYSVRNTAKLTNKGISTVQRIKTEFAL